MNKEKKKSKVLKIIFSSSILTISFFVVIAVCVLMIFNFFGAKITMSTVSNNFDYAVEYKQALNNNFKNGYVPLARILYFYLENDTLTMDEIYKLNINSELKILRDINSVCTEEKFKNMGACSESNINDNKEFLEVNNKYFNFPLQNLNYTITSFYNEERIVYGEKNTHQGWDFSASAETPIYSVCKGKVHQVVETQSENEPYHVSGNKTGNSIIIECNEDYGETYYVWFAHLYPNSIKVSVNDEVDHWTEIAGVGTTGHSTGNHLHFQMHDKDWKVIDSIELVDLNLTRPE